MSQPLTLITGANGEIGHGLIDALSESGDTGILALDIHPLDGDLRAKVRYHVTGDILDQGMLNRLSSNYEIRTIYHLAALLSTRAEMVPEMAHRVNAEGTLNLLHMASEHSLRDGHPVQFIFTSSMAIYGLPDLETKTGAPPVKEPKWNQPVTMYGCSKLYCEHLGRYYAAHYRQLDDNPDACQVDFRSVRFPGLISAFTVPTGGTSDYAPEMLHAAAKGEPYACFVREDTQIPFMAMPDAVRALRMLADAPRENLTNPIYNVAADDFNPTAEELRAMTLDAFPDAQITFAPNGPRQRIVDSWPAMVDDSRARADWGWQPEYGCERAFSDYLIPNIKARYGK